MKKIIFLLLLTVSFFSVNAQVRIGVRQKNNSKGQDVKEWAIDSLLRMPRDTLRLLVGDSGSMAYKNKQVYIFNGVRWDSLAGGTGSPGEIIQEGFAINKDGAVVSADTSQLATIGRLRRSIDSVRADSSELIIDTSSGLRYINNKLLNSKPFRVLNSITEFRTSSEVNDPNTVYKMKRNGTLIDYVMDASDASSADDGVTVIVNNGKRFKAYFENYILANWWPDFKPDGDAALTSAALQAAIDFSIKNLKTPYVKVLGGVYNVRNVTMYKPKGSGEYDFVSGTIEGVSPVGSTGNTTKFRNTDKNSFILNIENGRNCAVRNIDFEGEVGFPPSRKAMLEYTDNDWTSGGTIRNNRFSPQAGLVIDAFHATVAEGNRYPGLSSWYSNNEFEGSSNITIEYCRFFRFIAAILISPNGYTQNGDNISFRHGQQLYNKNFWVSCETQTRSNSIIDLYSVGYTETLINCKDYGYQQGTPPFISHSNMANVHKYLYKYDGPFGGITFDKCYMEGVYSLGISGDLPAVFINTEISLIVPDASELIRPSPVLAQGNKVEFRGGNLQYFDNVYAGGLPFNVNSLVFENCRVTGGVPFITNIYKRDEVTFSNVEFKNVEQTSWIYNKNTISGVDISQINGKHILPGTTYKTDFFNVEYTGIGNKIDNILIETASIFYKPSDNTGYFISSNNGRWGVGDMLTSFNQGIDWGNDFYGTSDAALGFVYAISGDTIKINHVPQGVTNGASFNLYKTRIPRFWGRTLGTVTSGSNVITNVNHEGLGKTFYGGASIKGVGIPAGAHVTGITGNSITISLNATQSASNVMLYDAIVKATTTNRDINGQGGWAGTYNQPWFVGDEWKNANGGEPVAGIFNTPGWTVPNAGQPQADYTAIRSQDNTNHAFTNVANTFTNGNNTWGVSEFGRNQYAGTLLRIRQSALQNGYTILDAYGNRNGVFGGIGVNGNSNDLGDLYISPDGGNLRIASNSNGRVSIGNVALEDGVSLVVRQNFVIRNPDDIQHRLGIQTYQNPNPLNGQTASMYSYNDALGRYQGFQVDAGDFMFNVMGRQSPVTARYIRFDSLGFMSTIYSGSGQSLGMFDANGRLQRGNSLNGDFTANNFITNGGILCFNTPSQYSLYAPNGAMLYNSGMVKFGKTVQLDSLAGQGVKYLGIDNDGKVVTRPNFRLYDLLPLRITTGSSYTLAQSYFTGYVGTLVIVDFASLQASFTFTLPTGNQDNTIIKIYFGGTMSTPGQSMITSFSLAASGTDNIIQRSVPTNASVGDVIEVRFYNGHWYRN